MLQKLDFSVADLYLQGAHLARFRDWLFLSSRSHFAEGKAIRGGVPVIFPWFGPKSDDAEAPQHGWARTALWEIETQSEDAVTLGLSNDGWRIRISYGFSDALTVQVEVQNTGDQAKSFEVALHTYFAISSLNSVQIEGLDGLTYLDKTRDNARFTQEGVVEFPGEVDRIYLNAPSLLRILDGDSGYELSGNWKSAVTWNPGATKATSMSDLGEGEWQKFVCLEVGAMADNAVKLEPQASYTMAVKISRL